MAPLSFLQQQHGDQYVEVTAKQVVDMMPMRVVPNLKTSTVEEALAKKNTIHVTAFQYLLDEIQIEIEDLLSTPDALRKFDGDIHLTIQTNGGGSSKREIKRNAIRRIWHERLSKLDNGKIQRIFQ